MLRSFFSDRRTGAPARGGTFLEIGAVDGLRESNTWVLDNCFGWRGVCARVALQSHTQQRAHYLSHDVRRSA